MGALAREKNLCARACIAHYQNVCNVCAGADENPHTLTVCRALLHQAAEHDYLQKCIDQPLLVLSLNYNVYSMLFDIQSDFYMVWYGSGSGGLQFESHEAKFELSPQKRLLPAETSTVCM